jgi:hypothetical protein
MGQMEQKTFEAVFPETFKIEELQGVKARVQLLVRCGTFTVRRTRS